MYGFVRGLAGVVFMCACVLVYMPAPVPAWSQCVLSMAREVDPEGKRTIGVVTKPDCIEPGCHAAWVDVITGRRYRPACVLRGAGPCTPPMHGVRGVQREGAALEGVGREGCGGEGGACSGCIKQAARSLQGRVKSEHEGRSPYVGARENLRAGSCTSYGIQHVSPVACSCGTQRDSPVGVARVFQPLDG